MRSNLAGHAAITLLLAAVMRLNPPEATAGPSSDRPKAALSVRITSPMGRTGLPGAIRIVAQVSQLSNVPLGPVRFYVNDVPAGDDADGPPYAVEWTDANPFEATRIRVDASDALGNTASDAIDLAPFEIVETTGVSRVLLEATVKDKGDRFVNGLTAASFRVLEDDEPQTIDLVSVESLPVTYIFLVDASQSMHLRMDFVRAAAGRLADFLRPKDQVIVAPFGRSLGAITGPTDDHGTIAGAIRAIEAKGRTAIFGRTHRSSTGRDGNRPAIRRRARHRRLRREQPGEGGRCTPGDAEGAPRGVCHRCRRRPVRFRKTLWIVSG
jgi:hypothetical protein